MAADKKATTKAEAPKAAMIKKSADTVADTASVQAAAAVEKKEPAKRGPKKDAAAKKETAKKPGAKRGPAKKADLKNEIHIQYSGKTYSQEDLIKIAKDVWKYDLKQKVGELSSVELYVKPEENAVYYVMNKDFTGSFQI